MIFTCSYLNDMNVDMILVGVGGTGGCFFTKMVRYLSDTHFEGFEYTFRIVDGDFVEAKNLGRQPFTEDDIGKNKAVALSSAAEEVLGVTVRAYPEYLKPETMDILNSRYKYSNSDNIKIIIGAVDNHACRKLLHDYFKKYDGYGTLFYIDAANELSCGEIVIGKKRAGKVQTPDRVHYFPEILEDTGKAPYEMSCEELNNSFPQHLATNSLAADLIFSYVVQLLSAGRIAHKAPGGIIYFDALQMFSRFDVYEESKHGKIG